MAGRKIKMPAPLQEQAFLFIKNNNHFMPKQKLRAINIFGKNN
jgi:hypothetical protein